MSTRASKRNNLTTHVREDYKNSLLFWFPKIKDLGIPVPKTEWVEVPNLVGLCEGEQKDLDDFLPYLNKISEIAKDIGYPVFIRTDLSSYKFSWKKSCFVQKKDDLLDHIIELIEGNELADFVGLPYKAIVIREFLELDWRFKAFWGELPISKERRYFVKNGEEICRHPYWIEETIEESHKDEGIRTFWGYVPHHLPNKWREMLREINEEGSEIPLLTKYAERVSSVLEGYWSIDFACTRDDKWYLIDMAVGYDSYHIPDCPKILRRTKKV